MPQVFVNPLMVEGLRNEFRDTYLLERPKEDSRLGIVMDLGLSHDNRYGNFGYLNSAPHPERWVRGQTIPTEGMGSVQFPFDIWDYGKRVRWHKHDRADEKTSSLVDMARMCGQFFGLIPERHFFELVNNSPDLLAKIPNAPDGAAFFATTAGGSNRFGVSSGNLLTGNGIGTTATVLQDYYLALQQFGLFQDGKGQPLFASDIVKSGTLIIHAVADTELFETAFLQKRQGVLGPDNTSDAVTSVQVSNIVQDASRDVQLWGTSRLATLDWYVFLKNPPKKATGYITRQALLEQTSFEGDNNSDRQRDKGEESIQWEERSGSTIGLPYGAIKINN